MRSKANARPKVADAEHEGPFLIHDPLCESWLRFASVGGMTWTDDRDRARVYPDRESAERARDHARLPGRHDPQLVAAQ